MNTLSPRQYLVQITIKTLQTQTSKLVSKAICQLHYNQNYIRYKTHPQISNHGIAHFNQQTICIPYTDDISLVFKRIISSKKEIYLGHYQIQIEEYLQRKIYFIQINQKLIQTNTYVNFYCKIIDKVLYPDSQTQDLSQNQSVMLKSQYSAQFNDHFKFNDNFTQQVNIRQSQSQYRSIKRNPQYKGGKRSPRQSSSPKLQKSQNYRRIQISPLLPLQFNKKLQQVDQILNKKKILFNQSNKLESYSRNSRGKLKSQNIQYLQSLLKDKQQQMIFNTLMTYVVIGLISLFVGILIIN